VNEVTVLDSSTTAEVEVTELQVIVEDDSIQVTVEDGVTAIVQDEPLNITVADGPQGPQGPPGPAGSGVSYMQEAPAGDIDGENKDFELSETPDGNALQVRLNGLVQELDHDYTIEGQTITFFEAPISGDRIMAEYLVEEE
jgi:hypothetical protein